ncbi:AraC family transcriptional regulator [Phytoactinopolyspora mesophila]|uniref:AraC family transcriptional regulator n=1 Tax=Phytoactinopolyspora mesophila TaxID=2650750 RepID=UPI0013917B7A
MSNDEHVDPLPLGSRESRRPMGVDNIRKALFRALQWDVSVLRGRGSAALKAQVNWHHLRGTAQSQGLVVSCVEFSRAAKLKFQVVNDEYAVLTSLSGTADLFIGGEYVYLELGRAVVITQADRVSMELGKRLQLSVLRATRVAFEEMLADLTGEPVLEPLRFERVLNLGQGHAQSWWRMWELLHRELDTPGTLINIPRREQQYEAALLEMLLSVHAHNYDRRMTQLDDGAGQYLDTAYGWPPDYPRYLRRALNIIRDHPTWDYTSKSLAAHAGIGERMLEKSFREHLGASPMAHLRNVRLDLARERLLQASHDIVSIRNLTAQMGFHNYGNFTKRYQERFGERPSETLCRARSSRR